MGHLNEDILSFYILPLLNYDELVSFSAVCKRWQSLSKPLMLPNLYAKLFGEEQGVSNCVPGATWEEKLIQRKKYRLHAWGRYFGRFNGVTASQPTELIDRGPIRSIFVGPEGPGVVTFDGRVVYRSWRPHLIPSFIYKVFSNFDDLIATDSRDQAFLIGRSGPAFRGKKVADGIKMVAGDYVLRTNGQVSHHGSLIAREIDQISSNGLYLDWYGSVGVLLGDLWPLDSLNSQLRLRNEKFTKLVGCNQDTYLISNHGRLYNCYYDKVSELNLPEAMIDVAAGSATKNTRPQVFLLSVSGAIYAYGEALSQDSSIFGIGDLPRINDRVRLDSVQLVSRGPAASLATDGFCAVALILSHEDPS